jgi:hypothetical protein
MIERRPTLKLLTLGTLFGRRLHFGLIDPTRINSVRKALDDRIFLIVDGRQHEIKCRDENEATAFLRQLRRFTSVT